MKAQTVKNIACKLVFAFFSITVTTPLLSTFMMPQKTDFTGTWNINISKSIFDSVKPDIAPKQIVANQSLSSIVLTKTFEHPGTHPTTYSQTLTFDGKPSERITRGETEKRVTTISNSKDTLLFNTHGYVNNQGLKWEYTAMEWWNLSKDQKTLTIQRKAVLPDRTEVYKAVYDKMIQ